MLQNVGGTNYEIPKGWCGFGLKLRPAATALKIFEKWPVTFHGCKVSNLPSILREGSLLMPGDKLMDGTELKNAHTVTGEDNSRLQIWTSPSVLYSELDIYTEPVAFEGQNMRVVLQYRQNPNSMSTCGETIGWTSKFGTVPISPHVDNKEIECFTSSRASVIPYRVLIKVNSSTCEHEELRAKTVNVGSGRCGVGLKLTQPSSKVNVTIDKIQKDSAADASGLLKPGDVVVRVEDRSISDLEQHKELLIGQEDSQVAIEVARSEGGTLRIFEVILTRKNLSISRGDRGSLDPDNDYSSSTRDPKLPHARYYSSGGGGSSYDPWRDERGTSNANVLKIFRIVLPNTKWNITLSNIYNLTSIG